MTPISVRKEEGRFVNGGGGLLGRYLCSRIRSRSWLGSDLVSYKVVHLVWSFLDPRQKVPAGNLYDGI